MRLIKGDCIEEMRLIEPKSVDCVIADVPYGTTKCKWDVVIPFDEMWECLGRVAKDDAAILLFGAEPFSSYLRMSNVKMYRYDLYWHKTLCSNFVMGKRQPFFKVENICVFYKNAPSYNPQMVSGKPYSVFEKNVEQVGMQQKYCFDRKRDIVNDGTRYPDNLLEFGSVGGRDKHPTQKPLDLMEWLVRSYTNEGDTVLDFCMGSGTTGVACKNLNRNFIGIEKEEKYFEVARGRLGEQ